MSKLRVAVVSLGGTIASTGTASTGVTPTLTAADMVAALPGLDSVATVHAEALLSKPSGDLDFDDMASVYRRATELVADEGYDGVVVTQGTDTLEETSFALDLWWSDSAPVVFTGAMRNPTVAGADGPANLLAAVRVAASRTARGRGVLVVMGDEIHAARLVRKTHTSSLSAFSSAPNGPIGFVGERQVSMAMGASRPPALSVPSHWTDGVELVTATLGGGLRLLGALVDLHPSGVVIAGFGGGHVRAQAVPLIDDLVARVPVVLASRVGVGRVLEETYGFPGGEIDLLGRGLLHAGDLSPLKARILLTALVSLGGGRSDIESAFRRYAQYGSEGSGGHDG